MQDSLERQYSKLEENLGFYFGRAVSYPLLPPEHVYFALTNRCNLSCRMCGIAKNPSRKEDELKTPKVKEIILQAKELGVRHIIFSGGEPLLRDDIADVVEFSTASGVEMVDIISNGTLLDEDTIQRLIKGRLNHITISLDGPKETNDSIRGEGAFEKSKENIDKLNYYKNRYGTSRPTVGINFTVMDKNIADMVPMVGFAREKKCNIIVFQPLLFDNVKMYEKKKNVLWPSPESIAKLQGVIKELIDLKKSLEDIFIYTDSKILAMLPDYFRGRKAGRDFKCYEAIKRVVITHNGTLWSCVGNYGDLKKNSLKEIWFSQAASQVRNKVKLCREHCLQDCVYFPSDILEQTRSFLRNTASLPVEEQGQKKAHLLNKIDFYRQALSGRKRLLPFNDTGLREGIRNLRLIRREIE